MFEIGRTGEELSNRESPPKSGELEPLPQPRYSQVGSNSRTGQICASCFFLRGRVVLNKKWLGKVQGQTSSPSKYFRFSMYCAGDMDGCMKVAIFC